MADHSKPTSESLAANFAAEIDARLDDITLWLDPATTTPTNLPAGAKSWSAAAKKWKKWTGTAWEDLEEAYAIAISGNAGSATKLATARTVTLDGDVSGSALFDGSSNLTITVAVADNSHAHVISNVNGLTDALASKLDDSDATATPAASKIPVASASGVIDAGWNDPLVAREMRVQALGVNPTLDLDFSRQRYRVYDGAKGLVEIADPWASGFFTFSRASTKNYFDAMGAMAVAGVDIPAVEFDPATGECLGLLYEPQSTNLFLNSEVPATQTITTSAKTYTVSFWGDGSITLSGSATGTATGIDDMTRTKLTVAASSGSVVVAPSGSVTRVQFESGRDATSYIQTTGSAVVRAADELVVGGGFFTKWYKQSECTVFVEFMLRAQDDYSRLISFDSGTTSNRIEFHVNSFGSCIIYGNNSGSNMNISAAKTGVAFDMIHRVCAVLKKDDIAMCVDDSEAIIDTSTLDMPVVSTFRIGSSTAAGRASGYFKRFMYFPIRLTNKQIQELTK